MGTAALVFVGGGLGALARWGAAVGLSAAGVSAIWPTLVVNVVGCFLMGLVQTRALELAGLDERARVFITTGLLGGLTTYSTFAWEATQLAASGELGRSAGYALLTTLACASAAWGGVVVARSVWA